MDLGSSLSLNFFSGSKAYAEGIALGPIKTAALKKNVNDIMLVLELNIRIPNYYRRTPKRCTIEIHNSPPQPGRNPELSKTERPHKSIFPSGIDPDLCYKKGNSR